MPIGSGLNWTFNYSQNNAHNWQVIFNLTCNFIATNENFVSEFESVPVCEQFKHIYFIILLSTVL